MYDCSKTLDYFHEVNRMCSSHGLVCKGCIFDKNMTCTRDNVSSESISKLQKWSDANPEE